MQRLEVSGAVRPIYGSLGVKGMLFAHVTTSSQIQSGSTNLSIMKPHAVNKNVWTSIRAEGVAPALSNSDRAFCKISWSGFVPSPEFFYCRQQWTDKRTEKFPSTKSPKMCGRVTSGAIRQDFTNWFSRQVSSALLGAYFRYLQGCWQVLSPIRKETR